MVKRINSRLFNPQIKEMIHNALQKLYPKVDFYILFNGVSKQWVVIIYDESGEKGYRTYKVIDSERGLNGFEFIETDFL